MRKYSDEQLKPFAVRLAEIERQHGPADFTITEDADFPSDGQRAHYDLMQDLNDLGVADRMRVFELAEVELGHLSPDETQW